MQFSSYAVHSKIISTVPCSLFRIQGYFAGATADRWLQLFDSPTVPADDTVPLRSYLMPKTSAYHWGFEAAPLVTATGLTAVMSSTEVKLTAVAEDCDFCGDYGPNSYVPSAYSVSGDASTGRDELAVWADAGAGADNKLYEVRYENKSGADAYLMLFTAVPTAGDTPVQVWGPIDDDGVLNLSFGGEGISSFSQDGIDDTSGTQHLGCLLYESSTAEVLTATTGNDSFIRAYYTT
jgi:hypothetical protein